MRQISLWLWAALVGAVLQFVALGSNFYDVGETTSDAWFGVPHASDLILASALVTVLAFAVSARGRSPFRGRTVGLLVALFGGLATAQLAYRMAVPPFGCLTYSCGTTAQTDVTLLAGIWIGLAGCVLALLGGLGHAFSAAARRTVAAPAVSLQQAGMTPWLGLGALGLLVAFVAPFTAFKAYRVEGFFGAEADAEWGGWLSAPHTSSLVLAIVLIVGLLVAAAARRRAPLTPAATGAAVAVGAFVVAARELFRIVQPPFTTAGGASDVDVGAVAILLPFWIGFAAAVVAVGAGLVQAVLYYRDSVLEHEEPTRTASTGREARAGAS